MKILCKTCTHKSVCKHKYNYERTIEALDAKVDTPFSVLLECPFYQEESKNYGYYNTLTGSTNSCVADIALNATEAKG